MTDTFTEYVFMGRLDEPRQMLVCDNEFNVLTSIEIGDIVEFYGWHNYEGFECADCRIVKLDQRFMIPEDTFKRTFKPVPAAAPVVNGAGKKVKRSTGPFGWNTIYRDGIHKYMTRLWLGRARLHYFWHSDLDGEDPHDHPWPFWTFPFHSYVEEVTTEMGDGTYIRHRQIVPAFKWNFRPAEHLHRVLGRYSGNVNLHRPVGEQIKQMSAYAAIRLMQEDPAVEPYFHEERIVTVVWRGKEGRKWGFLKYHDGRYCWIHWKEYVLGGERDTPCQ